MENRRITCTVCPIGCTLEVSLEQGEIKNIKGNSCARGLVYGREETLNPSRTLTTTVRLEGGKNPVLPVRSSKPIPKPLIMECMKVINNVKIKAPVSAGDTVIGNILSTGADIIAAKST